MEVEVEVEVELVVVVVVAAAAVVVVVVVAVVVVLVEVEVVAAAVWWRLSWSSFIRPLSCRRTTPSLPPRLLPPLATPLPLALMPVPRNSPLPLTVRTHAANTPAGASSPSASSRRSWSRSRASSNT